MADLSAEAVEAGARAAYAKSSEWDKIGGTAQAIELHRARLTLRAALRVLNATRLPDTTDLRTRITAAVEQLIPDTTGDAVVLRTRLVGDVMQQVGPWMSALPIVDTAKDSETEALRAELEQHRSGESYEIGENYGRTTQANECVRELLDAVYPGDPMPDRPLDTVWNHLLEKVRVDSADVDKWRMLRLEPLGMEIGSPDEAYIARIRERLTDWFNVRAERKLCLCGEPTTLGTVHRTDGPCYVAESAASLRGKQ